MYVKCVRCGREKAELIHEKDPMTRMNIIWLVFTCSCGSPGALPCDIGEITEYHTHLYKNWSSEFDWTGTSLLGVRYFIEQVEQCYTTSR